MRCPTCHGLRRVFDLSKVQPRADMTTAEIGAQLEHCIKTCPDCAGTGVAHCCEGLRAQPDGEGEV